MFAPSFLLFLTELSLKDLLDIKLYMLDTFVVPMFIVGSYTGSSVVRASAIELFLVISTPSCEN